MIITVDDLVSEVRSMLDEENVESVTTETDILPALNRAQSYAANILSRHYESPLLVQKEVPTISGQFNYDIPEDALEERLEKVEVRLNETFYPMRRISYRDLSHYENKTSTSIPYYYTVVGNKFRLIPTANGIYPLRIWYLKDPLKLVLNQGRINITNSAENYVIVDTAGSDLTTEADNLNSYVNIIDAQSGIQKASFQIKSISGNKITFKTVPSRTTVLNNVIDTDMTALLRNTDSEGADLVIQPDDYISIVKGSCVPFFKKPFSNFLVQYAVAELQRKLGGDAEGERRVLEGLEKQVERSWVGREQTLRVKKVNDNWDLPTRRYYGLRNT